MVKQWIKLNCEKLGIASKVNVIMSEPSFFATPTMQACLGVDLDNLSGGGGLTPQQKVL